MAIWVSVVSEQVYIRCWTSSNSRLAESITEIVQVSWVYGFAIICFGHLSSTFVTSCLPPLKANTFCDGVNSYMKEFAPVGANSFL